MIKLASNSSFLVKKRPNLRRFPESWGYQTSYHPFIDGFSVINHPAKKEVSPMTKKSPITLVEALLSTVAPGNMCTSVLALPRGDFVEKRHGKRWKNLVNLRSSAKMGHQQPAASKGISAAKTQFAPPSHPGSYGSQSSGKMACWWV